MENQELEALLKKKEEAETRLKEAFKGLSGLSPMSLMTGGAKSLEGLAAQFESVAFLNNQVINELARRALNNG